MSNEKLQYLVFISLSLGVMALAGIQSFSKATPFQRFFGNINPLVVVFLTSVLGIVLLTFLLSRGQFAIYRKEELRGLALSSGLAALFAFVIILVDIKVVFPADLNVLFPESLLFYPAIGYVVEILFHVLPLSLLFFVLTTLLNQVSYEQIIRTSIPAVALLEPVYQIIPFATRHIPLWAVAYVGLHVFLINLAQLLIFKRYDFVTMYWFRLVYYMLWHVTWGFIRLKLLF